jgi:aminopeptidase-like protein
MAGHGDPGDASMAMSHLALPSSAADLGVGMHGLIAELYPICRSITGEGLRETLRRLQAHIPLTMRETPSGTPVFDWTVPKEWSIRDAYIADGAGRRLVDFAASNLHVLNYSAPVDRWVTLDELRPHLFTLPDQPDVIPYRTSYYQENWGFCMRHRDLEALDPAARYRVVVDSSLTDGSLTYGECFLPGATTDEVLISCHACHPSLCNDNLSGVALATFLARYLAGQSLRYSYRFVFIPGTIGAITWLAQHEREVDRIRHGLVITGVGDPGAVTYKRSRRGDAGIDRAMAHVLRSSGRPHTIVDFSPYGYDERQYCSPGFNLPVGCLMRTPHGQYPQYHTSADDLSFVRPEPLADSFMTCLEALFVLEHDRRRQNLNPKCEPQLGRRGLYRPIGGQGADVDGLAILWVLNLSDGEHSLLDIAERAGISFMMLKRAADLLQSERLLSAYPA